MFLAKTQRQGDLPDVAQGVPHLAASKCELLTVVKNL